MRNCSNARGAWAGLIVAACLVLAAAPAGAQSVYADRLVFSSTCEMTSGSGSPEGAVTGKPCDVYLQSNAGSVAAVFWVKMTGTDTNTGWQQVVSSSALSGSGTSGYIPKWTGTGTLGDSLLSESGSTIGAAASLSLTGDNRNVSGSADLYFALDSDANETGRSFRWYNNGVAGTELMRLLEGGTLGLGTASPDTGLYAKLHVHDASVLGRIKITGSGTGYTRADLLLETDATGRGTGTYTYDTQGDIVWFWGNPYSTGSAGWALNYKPSATSFAPETAQVGASGVVNALLVAGATGYVGFGVIPTARLSLVAGTTAASGIAFGSDTNLYRSAADILKTDDALHVQGQIVARSAANDSAVIAWYADDGVDNSDLWLSQAVDGGNWRLLSYASGSWTEKFSLTNAGASTFAGSVSSTTGYLYLGADTNLYRNAADMLRTSDSITVDGNIIGSNGYLYLGADTSLYRGMADWLYTGDNFYSTGIVQADSGLRSAANVQVLNKAAGGWLSWATRDTAGAEVEMDLTYLGSLTPRTGYSSDIGAASSKFRTLHATELQVDTLVAQSVLATIGGRIVVADTTLLTADLAAAGTTLTAKHNNLANGDRIYLEGNGAVEWMSVDSAAGGSAGAYTYTVTRNLDGSGANDWYAGDAVMNSGTTGDGFIDLYSERSLRSATEYGPAIVGNVRTGTTFSDTSPRWAIGNLNGLYGYSTTTYGAAFGDPSNAWLKIDATNGIRIGHNATTKISLNASGDASFTGTVNATAGAIGGFTLAANTLSSGTDADYVALMSGGTNAIQVGDSTFADAEFSVTSAGAMKATSATITGTVNATAGYFGSASTDVAIDSDGITVGSTGRVNSSGATAYGTGTGFWLGYDSAYKWRVGDPSGDRLAWDGSTLTIVQQGKQLGEWTSVTHSGSNFTAPLSMTWTVDSADQYLFQYMIIGKTMTVNVVLRNTSIGGTLTKALKIKIPASKIAAKSATAISWIKEHSGASWDTGEVLVLASGDYYPDMPADWSTSSDDDEYIWIFRSPAHAAFPSTSTDSTHLQFSITFEIV